MQYNAMQQIQIQNAIHDNIIQCGALDYYTIPNRVQYKTKQHITKQNKHNTINEFTT